MISAHPKAPKLMKLLSEPEETPRDGNRSTAKKRILLAEDHNSVRFVFGEILRRRGFDVTAVNNGQEALDAWRNGETSYDLVLLDVVMPKVNGYDTYVELRRRHPAARFLFVSGYTDRDIASLIRQSGETCLEKPIPAQELVEAVHQVIDGGPATA